MPYQPIALTPGIDVEKTPVLNSAGWSQGNNVRFYEGLPQKIGGWSTLNLLMSLLGTARGFHAWADNSGNPYGAIGTQYALEIFYGGSLTNITPILNTTNVTPDYSTVINTNVVTVVDTANGAVVGDYINIVVPVSVGGLILQGFYQVQSIVSADSYTIFAASNATATVNNGGAVPEFTTINTQTNVTVTFNNHGYIATNVFNVQVSTPIASLTLLGPYTVVSVTDANNFVITPGGTANASTSVFENSSHSRTIYYIHSGLNSSTFFSGNPYGSGPYGGGVYGGTSSSSILTIGRYWSLSHFGQDLIANYNGSPFYVWVPPLAPGNNALELNTTNFPGAVDPPKIVNVSFASATQQMIIALGTNIPNTSTYSPNLVRWCDAGDFTNWDATSTNLAGSFQIPSGSKLVSGIATANFNLVWTDVDMWVMSWLGAPLAWGFQKVADAVDIIGPHAAGVYRNAVMWPSSNGFYIFDGQSVRQIPCPVWDFFWSNLDRQQTYKINANVNSWFNEISWSFPSASGNGECDSRVTYNIRENVWTCDNTSSTAWTDDSVLGAPIGCDVNGYLQQFETTNNAAGLALPASIISGWFALAETDQLVFIERVVVDMIIAAGDGPGPAQDFDGDSNGDEEVLQFTIFTQDWPGGPVTTYGPYTWTGTTGPQYNIVRARGRMARIQIESTGLEVFWRLGKVRFLMSPTGRGN